MRTTISIDDSLLDRAKHKAQELGQTLGQYVESAIQRDLVHAQSAVKVKLPVFTKGTGMRKGLNPSSNRALYDALDASGDLK
ncbi:MAG: antitoxin [Microbacteriaceae bacterium]|nr:hypothetical protein [Cryobacterium sp.]MBX3104596.1 hypothetical protein [Cryobacterium sp.]MCC6377077.1 antitoxin [Microbacteriaceae bacterium]